MTEISQDLIDRVIKLLNLAEDPAATENESAVAAAKAQRILTEYNLKQDDIRGRETPVDDIVLETLSYGTATGRRTETETYLFGIVADHLYCRAFSSLHTLTLIGRRQDVEVATRTFKSLRKKLDDLAMQRTREYVQRMKMRLGVDSIRGRLHGEMTPKKWRSAWYIGALSGVNDRLASEKASLEQQYGGQMTALVRRTDIAIDEYLSRLESFKSSGPYEATFGQNEYARSLGYHDGRNLSPNAGELSDT